MKLHSFVRTRTPMLAGLMILAALPQSILAQQTIGGGAITTPATGPAPAYSIGGPGFVLVKNWNFGTSSTSTIKNMSELDTHFNYHNQNQGDGTDIGNGARWVASSSATSMSGQPVELTNTGGKKVREFFTDSMRTYVVPLNGATQVKPGSKNTGCGSVAAKYVLPLAGSLLNQDLIWETRVRYVPPKQFYFSIWTCGRLWTTGGAEVDLIESYDYNNGSGFLNTDGGAWHSAISRNQEISYSNWTNGMASVGITDYDASQYHTWTMLYRADNTCVVYVDGIEVQRGKLPWRRGGLDTGIPIDFNFKLDGTWGFFDINNPSADRNTNKQIPATELDGKYYEWDYSRVYLRGTSPSPIVDNPQATVSTGWSSSTAGEFKFLGTDFLHTSNLGTTNKTVRWTPNILTQGRYEVHAMWTGGSARPTSVRYDVEHAGGTAANIIKDQTSGGAFAQWFHLGTWNFNSGTSTTDGSVLLTNGGTTAGNVAADAIAFMPMPSVDLIVDNTSSGFTLTSGWSATTSQPGQFQGANYLHDGNAGKTSGKAVRWTPNIPSAGTYAVYAFWNSTGSNRSTNVSYTIYHANGSSLVTKNQNTNPGQWNLLGTYEFNAGSSTANGSVRMVTAGTNYYVVADAVRFVKQ